MNIEPDNQTGKTTSSAEEISPSTPSSSATKETRSSQTKTPLWTRDFVMIIIMNFLLFCGFQAFPSSLPLYVKELGGSDVVIGWITGINTVSALLIRPFGGMIVDRFGRKGILLISLVIMMLASFSYSFAPYVALILGIRFIHGLGWGTASTAASTIASDIIPVKRFGEGMGYYSLSGSLAMAIAPGVSIMLFYAIGMEAVSYAATGMIFLSLILSLFLNYQKVPRSKPSTRTEKGGAVTIDPELKKLESTADEQTSKPRIKLFERTALFPSSLIAFVTASYGAVITFVAVYAASIGITDIGMFFTVYAVVLLVTRPFFGKMVDSNKTDAVIILGFICATVSLVLLAFASELWMFLTAGALLGIAFGSSMSGLQTMAVAFAPLERRGAANATYFVGFDAGLGLGSVVAGLVVTSLGYSVMYLVFATLPIIATIAYGVHIHRKKL